jgi:hypothetical protein
MPMKDHCPKPTLEIKTHPFDSAAEAWFWFVQANDALNDGARRAAGKGLIVRPCEPSDILKILDTLHRARRLLRDHLLVLRHYGRRQMPPDPRRLKELRAHDLWKEALERMEPVMVRKGIVRARDLRAGMPNKFWSHQAVIIQGDTHETFRGV